MPSTGIAVTKLLTRIRGYDRKAEQTRLPNQLTNISGGPGERLARAPREYKGIGVLFPTEPLRYSQWATRYDCHNDGIPHLTSHLLLFKGTEKLFVQRRNKDRIQSGGLLSQSIGGHVKFNQRPVEAIIMEAREEAGIGLCEGDIYEFARYWYESHEGRNREVVSLYAAQTGKRPVPGRNEASWIKPFTLEEIMALVNYDPKQFSRSFLQDLKWLYIAMESFGLRSTRNFIQSLSGSQDLF